MYRRADLGEGGLLSGRIEDEGGDLNLDWTSDEKRVLRNHLRGPDCHAIALDGGEKWCLHANPADSSAEDAFERSKPQP
jgi:hypothetical protein